MGVLFSLGGLERQAPLEKGDKSAGFQGLQRSLTPALVSTIHTEFISDNCSSTIFMRAFSLSQMNCCAV